MRIHGITRWLGLTLAVVTGAAHAVDITGAGATFPYPIYAKWAEAYKAKAGVGMNYQSIGSGGGIAQIKAKTVDFGASDMPLKAEDLQAAGLTQFPAIIGGVVPVVNIDGIQPGALKLTGPVLADIYLGKIKKWNEKPIADLNGSLKLPDEPIAVVRRSDGSGTTFIWTDYLSKVSDEWKTKVGSSTAVSWPEGVGGKGNEGVAAYVQRIKGSIGYVEYAYAKRNKMSHVSVQNKEGQFVQPDDTSFQAAAAYADWKNAPGFYQILTQPARQDDVADHGRELHPAAGEDGQAAERRGSPEVLRLGLQERPEDGRRARLRAAAAGRRQGHRGVVEGADQGSGRQAGVAGGLSASSPLNNLERGQSRFPGTKVGFGHRQCREIYSDPPRYHGDLAGYGSTSLTDDRPRGPRAAGSLAARIARGGGTLAGRPVRAHHANLRVAGVAAAARHHRGARLVRGTGVPEVRPDVLRHERVEPGHQGVRRAGADLRHAGDVRDRAAHRRAGQLRHRAVPHRDVSAVSQAAARHRGGAAGRHSVDHLRHVGPVRVRAVLRRLSPAAADGHARQCVARRSAVPGRSDRHRHAERGHHPVGDGDSLHLVGDARRVRGRPARC
jgi:phosphate transport system substrate-binding protein